jgi:hypothetical protein
MLGLDRRTHQGFFRFIGALVLERKGAVNRTFCGREPMLRRVPPWHHSPWRPHDRRPGAGEPRCGMPTRATPRDPLGWPAEHFYTWISSLPLTGCIGLFSRALAKVGWLAQPDAARTRGRRASSEGGYPRRAWRSLEAHGWRDLGARGVRPLRSGSPARTTLALLQPGLAEVLERPRRPIRAFERDGDLMYTERSFGGGAPTLSCLVQEGRVSWVPQTPTRASWVSNAGYRLGRMLPLAQALKPGCPQAPGPERQSPARPASS